MDTNDLTPAERRLVQAVQQGQPIDLSTADQGAPAAIRASVIARLAVDAAERGTARSIRVIGARITEAFDVEDQQVSCSLFLTKCTFEKRLNLKGVACATFCLDGSTIPGLDGDWLTAKGHLLFRENFVATGDVCLFGASIAGILNCRGARINPSGKVALLGGSLRATAVMLSNLQASGSVAFPAAQLTANFNADGAQIQAPNDIALNLERLQTGGYVFLKSTNPSPATRAQFVGSVRLYRAEVGANVELDGASISRPGGLAIEATGLTTKGGLFLRHGFEAEGEVRLESAQIGTLLDCAGGSFSNPGKHALALPGAATGRELRLTTAPQDKGSAPCIVKGSLVLERARIGSDFEADGLQLEQPVTIAGAAIAVHGRGASIHGDVFFRDARINGEVQLLGTQIDGRLHLAGATLDNPDGTCLGAASLKTGGSVFFGKPEEPARRFTGRGTINLSQAQIGGHLQCAGAQFVSRKDAAIHMYGATVHGDVYFTNDFQSAGEINLVGARVDGNLIVIGATLNNPDGIALNATRATVVGSIRFETHTQGEFVGTFTVSGAVKLYRATVLSLECDGGHISAVTGVALHAYGLTAHGDVFFQKDFRVDGGIDLTGASIASRLVCSKVTFSSAAGAAFDARRMSVGGGLCFTDVTVNGRAVLAGATCGSVECTGSRFNSADEDAFDASGLQVRGDFVSRKTTWSGGVHLAGARVERSFELTSVTFAKSLNLRHAHVGMLADEVASWPRQDLLLEAFEYDAFGNAAPSTADARLEWISRQRPNEFRPQVYETLARTLRLLGRDTDARKVAMAKREAALARSRAWWWTAVPLRLTIGHGYAPWRAAIPFLVMAVLGWGLFTLAGRAGAMTPAPGSHADVATVFGFQPLVYSIDTLLPVVDLQQEKYWYPNLWHRRGTLVRAYLWLHIAIGWILVSLLLAALTGMIKRE